MEITCRFYAPPSTMAQQHNLKAGATHKYRDLFPYHTCWSPNMGAQDDMSVQCGYMNNMGGCVAYQPEEQVVIESWSLDRGQNNVLAMVPRFLIYQLVETRVGSGITRIEIRRIESDNHDGSQPIYSTTPHYILSSEVGDEIHAIASNLLEQCKISQPYVRMTLLKKQVKKPSYFQRVLSDSKQD